MPSVLLRFHIGRCRLEEAYEYGLSLYIGRSPLFFSKKPPTRSCIPLITPPFVCMVADRDVTPDAPQTRFSNSRCGSVKDGTFFGMEKVDISSTTCLPDSYAWAPASFTLCVTFTAACVA